MAQETETARHTAIEESNQQIGAARAEIAHEIAHQRAEVAAQVAEARHSLAAAAEHRGRNAGARSSGSRRA